MDIKELRIERHDDQNWTLSAKVDEKRVFFTYQGIDEPTKIVGDGFVMAALIPAMKRKETIFIDKSVPVSHQLLENLTQYQEIYRHWYSEIEPVVIEAECRVVHEQAGRQSGCFFSGGVDSLYTVSKTLKELDYLILCRGLDIPIKEQQRWEKTYSLVKRFADNLGLKLITITTNVNDQLLCRQVDNHGAILVSNCIGLDLEKLFVPASNSWDELFPTGSHPITDPLLGNGKTQIVHHGNAFRTEKTEEIIRFGHGMDELRVCNVYADYNCGRCEKCLRTITCLEMLNKKVASLPALSNMAAIRKLRLEGHRQYVYWQDNYRLAVRTQNIAFAAAINKTLKRYQRRELLKEIDRLFFSQSLIRLKRRFT